MKWHYIYTLNTHNVKSHTSHNTISYLPNKHSDFPYLPNWLHSHNLPLCAYVCVYVLFCSTKLLSENRFHCVVNFPLNSAKTHTHTFMWLKHNNNSRPPYKSININIFWRSRYHDMVTGCYYLIVTISTHRVLVRLLPISKFTLYTLLTSEV